ncbi:MAG: c-type cytochrome, partial [Salinibacter sp.]
TTPQARGPETTFTFEETGVHEVTLVVQDPAGATDSATTEITVGNEPPTVEIDVAGNQSFYWDDRTLDYSVQVRDEEDGTVGQGIEAPDVSVTIGYRSRPSLTSSTATAEVGGQALLAENDCGTCHKKEGGSVGPSYAAIAERYGSDPPVAQLTRKVIEGGGGNWENTGRMPSHAALTEEEVRKMVEYIVSQDQEKDGVQSLPLNGTMSLTAHESRA